MKMSHNLKSFVMLYIATIVMGLTANFAISGNAICTVLCVASWAFVMLWILINFVEEVIKK